jgi:hypothetical protein
MLHRALYLDEFLGDQFKEDKMGGASGTHGRDGNAHKTFSLKTGREKATLKNQV